MRYLRVQDRMCDSRIEPYITNGNAYSGEVLYVVIEMLADLWCWPVENISDKLDESDLLRACP